MPTNADVAHAALVPFSRILYCVLWLMPEVVERHIERLIPEAVHGHLEPHGADVSCRVVEAGDDEVTKPHIDRGIQSLEVFRSEYVNLIKSLVLFINKSRLFESSVHFILPQPTTITQSLNDQANKA